MCVFVAQALQIVRGFRFRVQALEGLGHALQCLAAQEGKALARVLRRQQVEKRPVRLPPEGLVEKLIEEISIYKQQFNSFFSFDNAHLRSKKEGTLRKPQTGLRISAFLRKVGKRRGCPRHSSAEPARRVENGLEPYHNVMFIIAFTEEVSQ